MPSKKTAKKTAAATKKVSSKKTVKPVAAKKNMAAAKKAPVVQKTTVAPAKFVQPAMANPAAVKKLLIMLVAILLVAAVYFLWDEVIVASVNGKPITRWALVKKLEQQGASTILQNMTTEIAIKDAIKKANVEVSQAEIDQEMKSIEDTLAAQGQNLDDLLLAQGVSRAEVVEQIRLSKAVEKLLADQTSVTDEEVTAYYTENQANFAEGSTLDSLREQIREQLRLQKLSAAQQNWLLEVQQASRINYYKFAPAGTIN